MARVVFLGTPEYAVPSLEALLAEHEVLAVVTQPDRPVGRGRKRLQASPVKVLAERHGVAVFQPRSLRRDRDTVAALQRLRPDVLVLAAFGQILRAEMLRMAPHGCIGVHASLLPRLRGAAPVAAAILQGLEETGVTLMLTDEGLDTGPIIAQRREPIAPDDTTASLTRRLAAGGAALLREALPAWLAGEITPAAQDAQRASYAPPIEPSAGRLDWSQPARQLERAVRAYTPWPGTYTTVAGRRLKVLALRAFPEGEADAPAGTVFRADGGLAVATGEGLVLLERVQPAGGRAMAATDYIRGRPGVVGAVLGEDGQ